MLRQSICSSSFAGRSFVRAGRSYGAVVGVWCVLCGGVGVGTAADFTVNTVNDTVDVSPGDGVCADSSGQCSLRAAIMEGNALGGEHSVTVPAGTYALSIPGDSENLGVTGDLDMLVPVTIFGAGVGSTIIDGSRLDRVFDIDEEGIVAIHDLTIRNGLAPDEPGGGILNRGELSLFNVEVTGNVAGDGGSGGGIRNLGLILLQDVALHGNVAGNGGGLSNDGDAFLDTSCVYGNAASNFGGGIDSTGLGSRITLGCVTVSGNVAEYMGGGLAAASGFAGLYCSTIARNVAWVQGGGIRVFEGGDVAAVNSIVADNFSTPPPPPATSGPDCFGSLYSRGYNLVQQMGGCTITGDTIGNQLGVNPLLGPLADNGGPTMTHALLPGSPAIDRGGDPTGSPFSTYDQRNVNRPRDGDDDGTAQIDIGAFEVVINDDDWDNVPNDLDNCPDTANGSQTDADSDGAGDVCDGCRFDAGKLAPGVCGCGVADTDSDGDGLADCVDPPPPPCRCGICPPIFLLPIVSLMCAMRARRRTICRGRGGRSSR